MRRRSRAIGEPLVPKRLRCRDRSEQAAFVIAAMAASNPPHAASSQVTRSLARVSPRSLGDIRSIDRGDGENSARESRLRLTACAIASSAAWPDVHSAAGQNGSTGTKSTVPAIVVAARGREPVMRWIRTVRGEPLPIVRLADAERRDDAHAVTAMGPLAHRVPMPRPFPSAPLRPAPGLRRASARPR